MYKAEFWTEGSRAAGASEADPRLWSIGTGGGPRISAMPGLRMSRTAEPRSSLWFGASQPARGWARTGERSSRMRFHSRLVVGSGGLALVAPAPARVVAAPADDGGMAPGWVTAPQPMPVSAPAPAPAAAMHQHKGLFGWRHC